MDSDGPVRARVSKLCPGEEGRNHSVVYKGADSLELTHACSLYGWVVPGVARGGGGETGHQVKIIVCFSVARQSRLKSTQVFVIMKYHRLGMPFGKHLTTLYGRKISQSRAIKTVRNMQLSVHLVSIVSPGIILWALN